MGVILACFFDASGCGLRGLILKRGVTFDICWVDDESRCFFKERHTIFLISLFLQYK
jgi:hypothetical protein